MIARGVLLLVAGLLASPGALAAAPLDHAPLLPPKTIPLPGARTDARPVRPPPEDPQTRLDRLYDQLATAKDPDEAEGIAAVITALRLQSGSDTADLLTTRALDLLKHKKPDAALKLLNAVVKIAPSYAEAWNQLALIRYARGDYGQAMADLREVLRREPRHWAAWQALGRILEQTGDDKGALAAYRRALAIDPQLQGVQTRIDRLTVRVHGRQL